MPLFVITGHDIADSIELRKQYREAHLDRLYDLQGQNRLVIAGPTPVSHESTDTNNQIDSSKLQPTTGSVIIADFNNLEAAKAWVNDEPYLKAGVYSHVDIRPFIQVFPIYQSHANNE